MRVYVRLLVCGFFLSVRVSVCAHVCVYACVVCSVCGVHCVCVCVCVFMCVLRLQYALVDFFLILFLKYIITHVSVLDVTS